MVDLHDLCHEVVSSIMLLYAFMIVMQAFDFKEDSNSCSLDCPLVSIFSGIGAAESVLLYFAIKYGMKSFILVCILWNIGYVVFFIYMFAGHNSFKTNYEIVSLVRVISFFSYVHVVISCCAVTFSYKEDEAGA